MIKTSLVLYFNTILIINLIYISIYIYNSEAIFGSSKTFHFSIFIFISGAEAPLYVCSLYHSIAIIQSILLSSNFQFLSSSSIEIIEKAGESFRQGQNDSLPALTFNQMKGFFDPLIPTSIYQYRLLMAICLSKVLNHS